MRNLIMVCLLASVAFVACKREAGQHKPKTNVIKDYVNTPLDKARGTKNRLEDSQDRLKRQADLLNQ